MNLRKQFFYSLAQTSESPLGLEIEKAEGSYLFEKSGKKYLDLISGISVSNCGHNNALIKNAIKQQIDDYMHLMVYGEYIQKPQVEYATMLTRNLPEKLNSVYFVNSGSEAVEGGLKLAKKFTKRSEIICFDNAYHGSTHGSLSIIGGKEYRKAYGPLLPHIKRLKFNDVSSLDKINISTACVIIEPVQGEAGVKVANHDFLLAIRKKCDETGALLIFDEIQSGMGRTGKLFAFERYNIVPDILLSAKALGGGMPLGAFISSKDIMKVLSYNPILGHITTFGGHPVCCAAGKASLEYLFSNNMIEKVNQKEKLFISCINMSDKIKEIRSNGLLIAIELSSAKAVKKLINYCLINGVIADWFLFNDKSIRIAPPLNISEEDIYFACSVINNGLKEK